VLVETALLPPQSTMGHQWEELGGSGGRGRTDAGRGGVLVDQDRIVVNWGDDGEEWSGSASTSFQTIDDRLV